MIDKGIPIKNVYHMLCYAWDQSDLDTEVRYDWESMSNIDELLSSMLVSGVDYLRKKGFFRSYRTEEGELPRIRGRVDVVRTMSPRNRIKRTAHCQYDEYDMDNQFNRILYSTMLSMMKVASRDTVKSLKKLIPYFSGVTVIRVNPQSFFKLEYDRFNTSYHLIMNICELYWLDKMSNEESGERKFLLFSDSTKLNRIFEKFLLKYYAKHFPQYSPVCKEIDWLLEEDFEYPRYLQKLIPDIVLTNKEKDSVLIIDAKYYGDTLVTNYNKDSIRNGHVAQVYAYMHNYPNSENLSMKGMLIYPETTNVSEDFPLRDGSISIRTVNLNKDWKDIEADLDRFIAMLA